jgi:hypothetical protein
MDYFSRKSLSKYLMNNIEFNKHDVDIFINGTWQKYAGNIGRLFKITTMKFLHQFEGIRYMYTGIIYKDICGTHTGR